MRVGNTVTTLNPKHEKFMDIGIVSWIGEMSTAVRYSDGKTICYPGSLARRLEVVNIGKDYIDIDMSAIERSRQESKDLLERSEQEFRSMNGTGIVYYKQHPLVDKGEPKDITYVSDPVYIPEPKLVFKPIDVILISVIMFLCGFLLRCLLKTN